MSIHSVGFTRRGKLKLAAILEEKPFAGAFGNSLAPQKIVYIPTNMFQKP
jgi:hypothetical protein